MRTMTSTPTTLYKPSSAAGEWLQHEMKDILVKLHNHERLTRADLATGALALSMIRRYNNLLAQERIHAIQRILEEINAMLAAHPDLLPFES